MMDRNFRFQIPDVGSELRSSAGAQSAIRNPQSAIPTGLRRRGFSFTEVLFAVMILGVGFIMIAAVFPVSLSQVKMNTEETNGAALARSAVNYWELNANQQNMPGDDGLVYVCTWPDDPTTTEGRFDVEGNMVQPSDRRYGWFSFYRRPQGAPYAQLILVPVHARAESQFLQAPVVDYQKVVKQFTVNNQVRNFAVGVPTVKARITNATTAGQPDILTFVNPPTTAVEGAFVVVADAHYGSGAVDAAAAAFNGHVYRLGRRSNPTNNAEWELAIGSDFEPKIFPGNVTVPGLDDNTFVFVVGRGTGDEGLSMDISAYTTFVAFRGEAP